MPVWPAAVDPAAPWFHGPPEELKELRPGSTVTQNRDLARLSSPTAGSGPESEAAG